MSSAYDEGPFRNWTGIKFDAGTDTPEDFIRGEDINGRYDDCDPGTEESLGTKVDIFPQTGTYNQTCRCRDGDFIGGHDVLQLTFYIPLSAEWPSCLTGDTSGAVIDEAMPGEPNGWDSGTPDAMSDDNCGKCYVGFCMSGRKKGQQYQLILTFYSNCVPGSVAQQVGADCC